MVGRIVRISRVCRDDQQAAYRTKVNRLLLNIKLKVLTAHIKELLRALPLDWVYKVVHLERALVAKVVYVNGAHTPNILTFPSLFGPLFRMNFLVCYLSWHVRSRVL